MRLLSMFAVAMTAPTFAKSLVLSLATRHRQDPLASGPAKIKAAFTGTGLIRQSQE